MTIRNRVSRAAGKGSLKLKRNSPHILFGAGVAGVVTSTVLACRATLKSDEMLDDIQHEIGMVKNGTDGTPDSAKDVAYVYVKSAARIAQAYAPALLVGGASIALLTGSHVQLTRRNTALTLAYTGLHKAYLEYRARVREEFGEDKEKELYYGVTLEEAKNEAGKLAKFKTVDPNGISTYARFFDEGSPNWHKNAEFNRLFIQCQQNYANNLLQARGHLFLNEVYDMLGIERSSAGQVVGWVINGEGDNFVDFGLFEAHQSGFVNGSEPSILLDFNVDGVVLDKF